MNLHDNALMNGSFNTLLVKEVATMRKDIIGAKRVGDKVL
jgi:hypothetical protein